ncbi:hypothetical protein NP233_g160 [Leucocoprinus birnbaumii]|uniref:F-box domain-containing protein n=1 Tax=Leucocoprinus birnbaumii TaxID=56174 RepID=A0AAD5Z0F5_9AGAR|nr:hypothetical protein NP233_g160 [Leucocoprinus birnbaumii]
MDLPQELISSIISHACRDRSTLYNLCLVSRAFLPEARRYLYRRLVITAKFDPQSYWIPYGCFVVRDNNHINPLLLTLTHLNPLMCRYINTFVYVADFSNISKQELSAMLNSSLRAMVNLKDLSLFHLALSLSEIVNGCTFSLDTIRYVALFKLNDPDMHASEQFHEFISQQPTLKRMMCIIPGSEKDSWTPWPAETSLRQLQYLAGDIRTIKLILPASSTANMLLSIPWGPMKITIPSGLRSRLGAIRSLCLQLNPFWDSDHDPLQPLLHPFQQLRILHISVSSEVVSVICTRW